MAAGTHLNGLRKAAIFMVLLGEEAASHICRHLAKPDVAQLTNEIAHLDQISPESAMAVLDEYQRLSSHAPTAFGGSDYAEKLLVRAFGEEAARQILQQAAKSAESGAGPLDSLQKSDPQQLARYLESEHPQTIALILAHLTAKQASALLLRLPDETRAESVRRLAQLRHFSPEVAQKVTGVLHRKMEAFGEQSRKAYAGLKGVADLLNQLEANSSKTILEMIEKDDAKLALGIRNLMFTFEDLRGVPEAGVRDLLGQMDKKTLALALRGESEELKNYIFKTMSSRAVEMLKEDMEVLGPVRAKDVQKAQYEAVEAARKLEAEGKLVLTPDKEDEYVV